MQPHTSIPSLFLVLTACANAASIARRDVRASSTLQTGWSYSGCYTDNNHGIRQLSRDGYRDYSAMTEESCIAFCSSKGYPVAGVEYSSECYCDYQLASTSQKKPEADCNMPCSGDSLEACGGSDRLSVFTNGVAAPVINPGPPGWSSLGCQNDPGPRLLSYRTGVVAGDSKMSVLQCTNACQAAGYSLAGVEYSSECYCDNQLRNTGSSGFDGCNMLCSGNSSEYCGGPNRINVYQASAKPKGPSVLPSGWADKGCLKDNVLGRALTVNVGVVGGAQNMSVGDCVSACSAFGYPIAGVEYSQECWCDSQIRNGGVAASEGCDMPCKGNTAEFCGGSNRLNIYASGSLTLHVLFNLFDNLDNLDKFYLIIFLNHHELLHQLKVYDKLHCIIYLVLYLFSIFVHLDFFLELFNNLKHYEHYEQLFHEDFHDYHHELFEYYCRHFVIFQDIIVLIHFNYFG
ncbi:WSC domain-containing protein [Colletotrichum scovillei]|uniref:WSC domain-containing protein n=1 Tax=Colletotrichum scovillei TaxID=1209932 RepID=A0A9P7R945_9PEZI|nr:WSC domain-containing protein [Colletotrichum scovillei]KAG7069975.1 WSC domain-containing protein [Colletotrichum scovillei]KAG7078225.1 WSC domain-containing protein [Colletotrichum scovillei]